VKVDQHISELLYDHDCVIVPAFGGFLASYHHAAIHPSQHTFAPPSKKIAFNIFLKQNDGLLANRIVNREKLSYSDALARIEFHVHEWQKELTEGKKLTIEKIGTFYFDTEKNLQFDPVRNVNYLREAFGFSTVQYLPVQREDDQNKIEAHVKNMMLRSSEKQKRRPLKLSGKTKQKILGTLIISSTLLWFSFNVYLISPHGLNLSSLNPFSSSVKTETVKKEMPPAVRPAVSSPSAETATAVSKAAVNPNPAIPAEQEIPETKTALPAAQSPAISNKAQQYFVIGGAFEVRENADAFVRTLQAAGFIEARILDTAAHLKKVCYKGFSNHADAVKELDNLKVQNKNAWVYRW
jgi:cell division septation protein DedD